MNTFFAISGAALWVGIICFVILFNIRYKNEKTALLITFFKFGFIYCRDEKLARSLNKIRKTSGRRLFIEAPIWFNRHIYNFGVKQ